MVLSDATIARLLAEGRIEIDPYDDALLQPSSVDVRVDRLFRVFHNNRYPFIDVKVEQAELTELVEVDDEHPFILHPGRVRARLDARAHPAARRPRRPARGQVEPRPARAPHPLDGRLHRPGLGRPRDARALERRQPADHDLSRDEDRADLLHADDGAGRDAVRRRLDRLEVQGPARADGEPLLAELRGARDGSRHRRDGLRRAARRACAARAGDPGAGARAGSGPRDAPRRVGRRAGHRAT